MTGAHVKVAQMENRMYKVVVGASHPERVLKDEVMRIKGTVSPEQLDAVLGRVYVKLGRNERTAPMAEYMKDLYGLPTAHRLFDPQKRATQLAIAKLKRSKLKNMAAKTVLPMSTKLMMKSGDPGFGTPQESHSAKGTNADREGENFVPEMPTEVRASSDANGSPVGAGGDPNDNLNLKAIIDFCERAKYYDDVYPIYVMLLELFNNVKSEEWTQDKETIKARLAELAPRGSNNIIYNVNMVNEKHVNHIDTVKDNGVGFAEKTSTATGKNDGRKKTAPSSKIVTDVYKYIYYDSEEGPQRIARLFLYLIEKEWIAQDTKPDSFLQLFSGEPGSFHIKWTGATSDLYALMKRLHDGHLITCTSNAGIWEIAQNHFKDKENKSYTDLHKQKEKKRSQKEITNLINLLVP